MDIKTGEIVIYRGESFTIDASIITSTCSLVNLENVSELEISLPGETERVIINMTSGVSITNELSGKFSFRITEENSNLLRIQERQDFIARIVFANGDIRTVVFERALTVNGVVDC